MKTYMANKDTATHKWYVIDAQGKTLGRLASKIATYLKGKHKPEYTPHVDTGDYIIVINAGGVTLSGNKAQNEEYHYHTGFPGGIKSISLGELRDNNPEKLLSLAVKGMMPRTPLGRQMLSKLKIYTGSEHPHQAQKPELLETE